MYHEAWAIKLPWKRRAYIICPKHFHLDLSSAGGGKREGELYLCAFVLVPLMVRWSPIRKCLSGSCLFVSVCDTSSAVGLIDSRPPSPCPPSISALAQSLHSHLFLEPQCSGDFRHARGLFRILSFAYCRHPWLIVSLCCKTERQKGRHHFSSYSRHLLAIMLSHFLMLLVIFWGFTLLPPCFGGKMMARFATFVTPSPLTDLLERAD